MPSHLSTIGLPVGSEAEFWDLAQRAGPLAQGVPVDPGTYFLWRDGSGAELWLQVAGGDQFVGMAPHYFGDSRVPARLTERLPAADGGPFDGAFRADTGAGPVRFDSPEFRRLDPLPVPVDVTLQLAAFAHEVEVFPTEAAFAAAQEEAAADNRPALAPRQFAAAPETADPDLPEARAVLTGVVLDSAERANGLSGRRFFWALVDTDAGTVDVVADPTLLTAPPPVGGVVSGSFWVSGRVRAE